MGGWAGKGEAPHEGLGGGEPPHGGGVPPSHTPSIFLLPPCTPRGESGSSGAVEVYGVGQGRERGGFEGHDATTWPQEHTTPHTHTTTLFISSMCVCEDVLLLLCLSFL